MMDREHLEEEKWTALGTGVGETGTQGGGQHGYSERSL